MKADKLIIIIALIAAVSVILVGKDSGCCGSADKAGGCNGSACSSSCPSATDSCCVAKPSDSVPENNNELHSEYSVKMEVNFIDVLNNHEASDSSSCPSATDSCCVAKPSDSVPANSEVVAEISQDQKLPVMIELGADKCIPCKMMQPIMDELRSEYDGKMEVKFIDVWKNPGAAKEYNIQSIPTQIFLDADGKEIFRHMGFFSKEDILNTWTEHGITF